MYAEGWLRGRWVECFLVIFLVVEVLTSPNEGAFFWPQRYPRLVSSQSPSFARASSSRWVQGLQGRRLALPLSLWLRSVRPFFIGLLLVKEDCICQGVFFNFTFSPDTSRSALGIFGGNPWLAAILWFVFLLSTRASLWRLGLSLRPVWFQLSFVRVFHFSLLLF